MGGPSAAALRFVRGWFEAAYLHEEWGRRTGEPGPSLAGVQAALASQGSRPPRADGVSRGSGSAPVGIPSVAFPSAGTPSAGVAQEIWPPRVRGVRTETTTIGEAPPVRVRWYRPAGRERDAPLPTRLLRPVRRLRRGPIPRRERDAPLPAWLLLHGVAVQGPDHPGLVRFASALASAGAAVAIPEIPAWSRLEFDPSAADDAVDQTLEVFRADSATLPGGAVLAGFSFGAPQAVRLAARRSAADRVRAVVAFGGYCSLSGALRFGLGGPYEWRGRLRRARPDPYGRWVVAANYLHRTPGFEDAAEVSAALRALAAVAGAHGVLAWEPYYDRLKSDLAAGLPLEARKLFRRFAPPAGQDPDPRWAAAAAPRIARAAESVHPLLSLPSDLEACRLPRVHLIHGRDDPLVPFVESVALARHLRSLGAPRVRTTVTRLFGHARESGGLAAQPVEALRFFWALRALMRMQRRPR